MPTLLKDYYDRPFIRRLATAVALAAPGFPAGAFERAVMAAPWPELALKQRMRRISTAIGQHLPGNYARQLQVLEDIAPQFTGLTALLFPDFVEVHGLDAPARSLKALAHFTRFSSAEFAVRPFLLRDPDSTMATMRRWAVDDDAHVRRLASEGCRPRLPWSVALPVFKRDPAPVLAVLELLKADPSDYVRRSVANNLNDIAKDHPGVLLDVARRWHGAHPDTDRLLKHACRTLLKQGDATALGLFGFDSAVKAEVRDLRVSPSRLVIGDRAAFAFEVRHRSAAPVTLRLEYVIEFARPAGRSGRKVFQITERSFAAGWHRIERRHAFADLSTRTHHPGVHRLSVVVNGRPAATTELRLTRGRRVAGA